MRTGADTGSRIRGWPQEGRRFRLASEGGLPLRLALSRTEGADHPIQVLGAPTNGLITFGKVIDGGVAGFLEITFHWPTPPSVQTLRGMQGPSLSALALLAAAPVPAADPEFSGIESFLAESVANGTVAGGTVLVLQHGEMVFKSGFGFADLERKTPFQVDTPVILASISKPLLGTAVFHLAAAGKLDPTLPISDYLPEFKDCKLASGEPVRRAPTVIELLTHTSGLRPDEAPGGHPWFADWTRGLPLSAVVSRYAREFPFEAQPGTRYAYSGIGTDVAARVAEVASGSPRNEMLRAEVCEPLGMTHTYYRNAESVQLVSPMPTRYFRGKDRNLLVSPKRRIPSPTNYSASGGTIISTATDLSKWLLMIRNGGRLAGEAYLAPETIENMLRTPQLGRNAQGGFFVRRKTSEGRPAVIGHSGSSGTDCWIDFAHDTIGILLTQTRGEDIKPFRIELEKRITACVSAP